MSENEPSRPPTKKVAAAKLPAKKAPAKKVAAKKARVANTPATKAPATTTAAKKAPAAKVMAARPSETTVEGGLVATAPAVDNAKSGRARRLVGLRRRPTTIRWPGVATQAASAVLLVGLLIALVLANHGRSEAEAAGAEASRVVVPHVEQLLSYTPTSVLSDLPKKRAWLTGDFAGNYELLLKERIAPAAQSGAVTVAATVTASGIDDATSDRVELLLFVNTQTTSATDPTPAVAGSRVKVTAQKVDGQWRISDMAPL